jgi:hypothetical protein
MINWTPDIAGIGIDDEILSATEQYVKDESQSRY